VTAVLPVPHGPERRARFVNDHPPPRTDLVFWPDRTRIDPYQSLLGGALPEDWSASAGDVATALARASAPNAERVVFHLHWTAPIFGGAGSEDQAWAAATTFIRQLHQVRAAGAKVVWTVHEPISHHTGLPSLEAALRQDIGTLANLVHVHAPHVLEQMAPHFTLPRDRLLVAAHPGYAGVYPEGIAREDARVRLGIQPEQTLFLFLGQIRADKGIDDLMIAFARLAVTEPDARLIVAGAPAASFRPGQLAGICEKVAGARAFEGFVPDDQLQVLFSAADYCVYPCKDGVSPGAALLAMAFGCPLVAPDLPAITEHVADGAGALLYRHGSQAALLTALRRAMMEDPAQRAAQRTAARAAAPNTSWQSMATALAHALDAQGDAAPPPPPALARHPGGVRRHTATVVEQRPATPLDTVLVASGAGPVPKTPSIRLAHVINLFLRNGSLDETQHRTVTTMQEAVAATAPGISVTPVAVPMVGEAAAMPDGFAVAEPLTRTARDLPEVESDRPLPLLFDILDRGIAEADRTGAEAIILTNADICPLPHFYTLAAELLGSGLDAVTINRRTVPFPSAGLDAPGLLAAEYGESHPGFDCFIFRRALYDRFEPTQALIGAGMVMRSLLFNLAAVADRMAMLTTVHATYHLGDDKVWTSPAFARLEAHNVACATRLAEHLLADPARGPVFRAFCKSRRDQIARALV